MDQRDQKVMLVTGGNRGIGLGIVKGLAAMGHKVYMGSRDLAGGEKAAAGIRGATGTVIAIKLDVSDKKSITAAVKRMAEENKCLDVLINNAGIIGKRKKGLLEGDVKEVKEIFDVNYFGPMRANAAFLLLLRKSKDGRIINMSSSMGTLDDLVGGYAGYRLSKAGLNAQTIQLANELRGEGIRIFAMCPGWVRTAMGGKNATRSVEEGADTAVWLATDQDAETGRFYRNRHVISW